MTKKFAIQPEDIKPLAEGFGACIATDMIVVDGGKVGFMYREATEDHDNDSGWVFMAGDEPQEFLDDPDNLGLYDVNTIANFDPEIIPMLESPPGTAFERDLETGEFLEVNFEPPKD